MINPMLLSSFIPIIDCLFQWNTPLRPYVLNLIRPKFLLNQDDYYRLGPRPSLPSLGLETWERVHTRQARKMELISATTEPYFRVTLLVILVGYFKFGATSLLGSKNLPPGWIRFPFLGETISFMRAQKRVRTEEWIQSRVQKYGPVFKTSLMGSNSKILLHRPSREQVIVEWQRQRVPGLSNGDR